MSPTFAELLKMAPRERTVAMYEEAFSAFVREAGGTRLTEIVQIPDRTRNADFVFDHERFRLLVELKQVASYHIDRSLDEYFGKLLRAGKVKKLEELSDGKVRLTPESLSARDWDEFYKRFRPRVSDVLRDANRQLRESGALLPITDRPTVGALIMMNTGDYHLGTDLLARLVEWRAKREWHARRFSSLDLVLCLSFDMADGETNPLHSRLLVRDMSDPYPDAGQFLFDRWVRHGAAAYGAEVSFTPGAVSTRPATLNGFKGKIVVQRD